jgi:4-hydroxybenzoate polyprenyltransferase
MSRLRAWLELCRVSNLPTVWTNVTAAWWIAGARDGLALLLAGASAIYAAGMVLNDACDAGIDRRERPRRPIPSGRVASASAWIAGLGGLALGGGLLLAGGAAPAVAALLVLAVLAYDWLHAKSAWTVLLMAACRALLWWLPADGITLPPVVWSGAIFLYIVAVSLVARGEAERRIATLPLLARALLLCPALAVFALPNAPVWPAVVFVLVVALVLRSLDPARPATIGRAVGWLLAAIPLIDAMAVAPAPLAILLAAAFPLCRLLQRTVPAT